MPSRIDAIRKDLGALAERSNRRKLIDEVADALPEIEQAIAAGATYAQICEAFQANGVDLSLTSLRTYLYRLRKAAAAKAQPKPVRKTPVKSPRR